MIATWNNIARGAFAGLKFPQKVFILTLPIINRKTSNSEKNLSCLEKSFIKKNFKVFLMLITKLRDFQGL